MGSSIAVIVVVILVLVIYVFARNSGSSSYTNVSPEDVKGWINDKDYQIIDVREPFEYSAGHVKKAINIPLGKIDSNLNKIKKDKKVVFICKSGGRSSAASRKVSQLGYDVYNMKGGMLAWTYETTKK